MIMQKGPKKLSDREKVIHRTFKMFVNKSILDSDEFHSFCNYAKGKSEAKLLTVLNSGLSPL